MVIAVERHEGRVADDECTRDQQLHAVRILLEGGGDSQRANMRLDNDAARMRLVLLQPHVGAAAAHPLQVVHGVLERIVHHAVHELALLVVQLVQIDSANHRHI